MMTPERNQSDVQRLLAQIDREYQSAWNGLSGLNMGSSRHDFITSKMEQIGNCHEQLINLIGDEDEAARLVVEQMNKSANVRQ
jgi:hypothetical protein